jgi:hypothetical protein
VCFHGGVGGGVPLRPSGDACVTHCGNNPPFRRPACQQERRHLATVLRVKIRVPSPTLWLKDPWTKGQDSRSYATRICSDRQWTLHGCTANSVSSSPHRGVTDRQPEPTAEPIRTASDATPLPTATRRKATTVPFIIAEDFKVIGDWSRVVHVLGLTRRRIPGRRASPSVQPWQMICVPLRPEALACKAWAHHVNSTWVTGT